MTETCPSYYPPGTQADIAFVGEAPGTEEMAAGEPLVGPSGRTFNQLLKTAGIDRSGCFITNVFNTKLPDNSLTSWTMNKTEARKAKCWDELEDTPMIIRKGKSGRWLKLEHWWHVERLHQELERVKPKVIVPLGATALWGCVQETHIMAWRGTLTELDTTWGPCVVVPTLHPAYVLRNWKAFLTVAGDLSRAHAEVERVNSGSDINLLNPNFFLAPELEDLEHWWETCGSKSKLLGVDIETGGGQIKCIGLADAHQAGIIIPFFDESKIGMSYWPTPEAEAAAWTFAKKVCESNVPKVMQHGSYDLYWLWRVAGIECRAYIHDTRLMHHAYFPEMPKSLEFLGPTYCRIRPWKTMRVTRAEKKDE